MLDLRHVIENLDEVRQSLSRRGPEAARLLDEVATLASRRLAAIQESETKASERNAANKDMASLPKDSEAFAERRDALKRLAGEVKQLEQDRDAAEEAIRSVLLRVPNLPDDTAPLGTSENDNPVVRSWGEKPVYDFEPAAHWDIGPRLGIVDFERAAKLSGARFTVMMGMGARLERALISLMLDRARVHGYTEVLPPLLVTAETMTGTGQLPKFEQDLFKTQRAGDDDTRDLYMIPTAEVPLTNLHAGEILQEKDLPIAYTAFTPCFRSEAGSYGKDVRGLIRQHQFNKVEIVRLCRPEDSAEQHELLTSHAEDILQQLGLHYRVVELCTADLGFGASKTYDLEVWLPGAAAYREISSCSKFGDFQARRASIRYRPAQSKKPSLVHTLNGSALAVGRTVVAILEQYQQKDGSVRIPKVLQPYLGEDIIPVP